MCKDGIRRERGAEIVRAFGTRLLANWVWFGSLCGVLSIATRRIVREASRGGIRRFFTGSVEAMEDMRKIGLRTRGWWVARVALIGVALIGMAATGSAWAGPMDLYYAATDTTHHDWDELALTPVSAITGPGDGHQWMTDSSGDQRVLVTTLVSPFVAGIYRPFINQTYTLGNTRQVWVTLAGELGDYLKARPTEYVTTASSISDRAKMALGTPVTSNYSHFVSFWVRPQDLFRPAIQWDVSQSTMLRPASGEHDQWDPDLSSFKDGPAWFGTQYADRFSGTTGSSTTLYDWYQDWWNASDNAATGPGAFPFPWTGLGYTYDYYYQASTMTPADYQRVVGVAEFVIAPKFSMIVDSVTPIRGLVVPEPSTWVLVMTAAGWVALRRCRSSRGERVKPGESRRTQSV